jgi:nicotinic acid phosphoribosyltransferase
MDPIKLQLMQVTLQALSAFSIAGGLVYAAIQFRQARQAQLVANFSKLVELQYQLRQLRVLYPELASVHKKDVEQLQTDREIKEYFLNLMQLSLFEIAWYAHQHGQIHRDYFDSWAKRMRQVGQEESFRRMIENPAMKIMHDDFEEYLRKLMATDPRRRIHGD